VLSPTSSTIRLFLHVLGATVWVGGQIVLAGLVPVLRREAPAATKALARGFARLAWPAFAVLVVTGIWNLAAIDVADTSTSYQVTVFVKVALSLTAAVAVAVHSIGRSKLALALGGAIGLLASLAALFVGILLRTGTA
jgi:putative copper export protein